MTIFPIIPVLEESQSEGMPIYREIKWDYDSDLPVFRGGEPVIVTGSEAVAIWAYNALETVRGRYPIFSTEYGNDCEKLIGQQYSDEVKQAEIPRYIRECLLINPYIKGVTVTAQDFSDGKLMVEVEIESIYGKISIRKGG